ncbi:glycoside hydrolase family 16 protein [Flagellimonas sp.]|uniref:glycoside hydrolase family 16 protein n=1 Tax=Flagellimonas sp. TaxID=2058762 RepID=UPI003B51752E
MTSQTKVIAISISSILLLSYLIWTGLSPKSPEFDTLVWSDEFEGEGPIDTDKWFHQTQLPPGGSWWGGIIQHYTDREANTYQKDGHLYLMAKKETFEDQGETKEYTSARLNSKFAFTYGKVEVRAKVPKGVGTWPAIWMLNKNINEAGAYWEKQGFGTTNWPHCGEIDIMEHWGKNQDFVQSAVHNGSSFGHTVENLGGQHIASASDQFHVYVLEWTDEKMTFSVDGKVHYTYNPAVKNGDTWPYDMDYYILFNIAIEPDIDPNFTESPMVVDYIRIYQ